MTHERVQAPDEQPNKDSNERLSHTRRNVVIAGVAGLALAAGAVVSVNSMEHNSKGPEPKDDKKTSETEVATPEAAKAFIKASADRYTDPLATWYAENALEKSSNGPATLNDVYFKAYTMSTYPNGATSDLRFNLAQVPVTEKITEQTLLEQFNSNLAPNLSLYINYLAKNPTAEEVPIIDNEFSNYIGYNNSGAAELITELKSVEEKYGSAANYEIEPAKIAEGNSYSPNLASSTGESVFQPQGVIDSDNQKTGEVLSYSAPIDMVVKVQEFNDKGQPVDHTEVISNKSLILERFPQTGSVDPGYVSFGLF